jgi:hypothetical protein
MAHRHELEERSGEELGAEASAAAYADEVDRESTLRARIGRIRRRIRPVRRPTASHGP